ncbi:CAP domain-containing protein [Clostridium sp.]|uniref:CAP domain-containing protein n=1 Tax=Clostridium sp. TaxID=1506 RepID=UPI0025B9018E|nr:CAP domain-containing protein [Clostridium sp.]MBS4955921.1 CAP domain-containing protein [Clostridium sp.]MDU4882076.1 CAP domain-containing protein [Clostridium celatum]MDU7075328.1 CAP domain-containing protein [Clostridium celatum]
MKNKLIASIVTLTIVGGTVTPTFAATKEVSLEKTNRCSISGSLLQGVTFKKIWWGNCFGGTIIIGGTVDKPNHNGNINNNDNNNNNSVIPPTEDTETPNVPDNPSIDQTPGDTVIPPTGDTETPSTPDTPIVDETPSVPEETPSTPDIPSVDETPDNSTEDNVTNEDTNFMSAVETAIFNKVNEERAKAGVPTLTYNTVMQKYARIKSQDMGDNNYFSHEDLNGNLITTQMKNDGVSYKAWGENIAYIGGNVSADALAEQFMTNWMNSSGHRANILSTNFSSIGVGVYKIGNKVYATQEFYR